MSLEKDFRLKGLEALIRAGLTDSCWNFQSSSTASSFLFKDQLTLNLTAEKTRTGPMLIAFRNLAVQGSGRGDTAAGHGHHPGVRCGSGVSGSDIRARQPEAARAFIGIPCCRPLGSTTGGSDRST